MPARLGAIGCAVSIIISVYPDNNWYKVAFGVVGILCFVLAYIAQHPNNPPVKKSPQKLLNMSNTHKTILKIFANNDNSLISVHFIEQLSGLESFVINSALDDLSEYGLIYAANLDEFEGGWQYQLSDKGRKILMQQTW